MHNPCSRHRRVRQCLVAAVVTVGETGVINADLVQESGEQARTADAAFNGLVAELVSAAVDVAGFEATAGNQQGEGVTIVIASRAALRDGQSAELARPQHDGAVQQAALLQIADEHGGGLIYRGADATQALANIAVVVPATGADRHHHLDEADARFHEAAGHEAARAEVRGGWIVQTVQPAHGNRLA